MDKYELFDWGKIRVNRFCETNPVSNSDWRKELGDDVPTRVVEALMNKGAK